MSKSREIIFCDNCNKEKLCVREYKIINHQRTHLCNLCKKCYKKQNNITRIINFEKCEICGHLSNECDGKYCKLCNKNVGECCSGLFFCQSLQCICKNCFNYKCLNYEKCNSHLDNKLYIADSINFNEVPLCKQCLQKNQ